MKKGLRFLALLLVLFIITGCELLDSKKGEDPYPVMRERYKLRLLDLSEEFDFTEERLQTYSYTNDPGITYVNIVDFITFMKGGIIDLTIVEGEQLTLTYDVWVPNEYKELFDGRREYTYMMTLDPEIDTISYNNIDMLHSMNPLSSEYESLHYQFIDFRYFNVDQSVTFPLRDYGMEIIYENGEYYLPLYLTNLFLTGQYLHVYEMNYKMIVFDDLTDLTKLIEEYNPNETLDATYYGTKTKDFLALYFNYFYGLKSFKSIDHFGDRLDNYGFDNATTFDSINRSIDQFINDLDDLHTSIISGGYTDLEFERGLTVKDKTENFLEAYLANACYERNDELSTALIENTFVLTINAFTLKTGELLRTAMVEAREYEKVLIDLSCNSGGHVVGVLELLSYMTDEDINLSYINPLTGSRTTEVYRTRDVNFPEKEFYILTSPVTFSAANLFANYVYEHDLGLLLGEPTSGGASAVQLMVLPNGTLISTSSPLTFVDVEGGIIEDGVQPPMPLDGPFIYDDVIDKLDPLIEHLATIDIKASVENHIALFELNIEENTDKLTILNYEFYLYTPEGRKLGQSDFLTKRYAYFLDQNDVYEIYLGNIYITYAIEGITKTELIYSDYIYE